MTPTSYDDIGRRYGQRRHADPRIAARLNAAIGHATSVLNVGAGTGSYEPTAARVVAVDPSAVMLAQRPTGAAPAVRAWAEALPVPDRSFDVVLAVLTIHHWSDQRRGLEECLRVARRRAVILTWDPESDGFWLVRDYFPDLLAADRRLFPRLGLLASVLGELDVRAVPIPADCADGFLGAFWRRPHAYLDPAVRGGMSSFGRIADVDSRLERLRADLASGAWGRQHEALMERPELDIGYRLVVADCSRNVARP
jgi:SAM-dependent methyltransferase